MMIRSVWSSRVWQMQCPTHSSQAVNLEEHRKSRHRPNVRKRENERAQRSGRNCDEAVCAYRSMQCATYLRLMHAWTSQCQIKCALNSCCVCERVHKKAWARARNMYNKCVAIRITFYLQAKSHCSQDTAANVIVSSMMDLTTVCCSCYNKSVRNRCACQVRSKLLACLRLYAAIATSLARFAPAPSPFHLAHAPTASVTLFVSFCPKLFPRTLPNSLDFSSPSQW